MKTILAPTDFSESSDNAVNYAAEMAKLTNSKLILLHVYHIPVSSSEVPVVMPVWIDVEQDCMMALENEKLQIQKIYGPGMEIACVVRMGFDVDEIIKQCVGEMKVDLVVMGMRGAGYLSEKLMGSTATSLAKESNCPVLIINNPVKFKAIKKIVLACDDEKIPSDKILDSLKELADFFKSEIYIVNVIHKTQKIPSVKMATADIEMGHSLEGIKHSFHFIENEDTINGINDFIAAEKIDMIVIIPRRHKFLDGIFHEGNTKRMAFHTSIPLLTLHE